MEWGFLEKIMLKMGFHANWVHLIMKCIMTVRFHILDDGKEGALSRGSSISVFVS